MELYQKNNKKCIFDPIRKALIMVTPEEVVRQKVIEMLVNKLGVPQQCILVEEHLGKFERGVKDRADIIVCYEAENGELVALLVIECKAPNISLNDDVIDQVMRYSDYVDAEYMMITNGEEERTWQYKADDDKYYELEKMPQYADLLTRSGIELKKITPSPFLRPEFYALTEEKNKELYASCLGEDSQEEYFSFYINLGSLFLDEGVCVPKISFGDIEVLEDKGLRYTSFGNAGGAAWEGFYRCLIIQDFQGSDQLACLSVYGAGSCQNHPVWKNRRGHTNLIVGIDDFDKKHNSLQLNLDKYMKVENGKYVIWHDGKITIGKKGAMPRSALLNFVEDKAPELIDRNGQILLGELRMNMLLTWDMPETTLLMKNLLTYALLRDQFRRIHSAI